VKKKKVPPKILPGYITNFETLKKAHDDGNLALVSSIRKADQKPVALVCAMSRDGGSVSIIPLAVMIEGDPFRLFENPTSKVVSPHAQLDRATEKE
jgi:hypothetical protein